MVVAVTQLFGHTGSLVDETNFETVFGGLHEGILAGIGNECRVSATVVPSMDVDVDSGTFVVGGVFAHIEVAGTITIAAAHAINPRIDRVILKRDNATDLVTVEYLQGTPGVAPVPPPLDRTAPEYECSLAQIYVAALAVAINPEDVKDEREDCALCGYVSGRSCRQQEREAIEGVRQEGYFSAADYGVVEDVGAWGLWDVAALLSQTRVSFHDADGFYFQPSTNNAIGADAAVIFGRIHRRDNHPVVEFKFKLNHITDVRFFGGISDGVTPWNADDPAGYDLAGIQFSTTVGANFQACVRDGAVLVRVDTEIPADTDAHFVRVSESEDETEVLVELFNAAHEIESSIVFDANLPTLATALAAVCGIETLANAVKSINHYYGRGINRGV